MRRQRRRCSSVVTQAAEKSRRSVRIEVDRVHRGPPAVVEGHAAGGPFEGPRAPRNRTSDGVLPEPDERFEMERAAAMPMARLALSGFPRASPSRLMPAFAKAFRYAEDRYAVLYRDKTLSEATAHLEQVRTAIDTNPLVLPKGLQPLAKAGPEANVVAPGQSLPITVSIGVAERDQKKPKAQDVVRAADKLLARAKRATRRLATSRST
jgi:hypothetical protein